MKDSKILYIILFHRNSKPLASTSGYWAESLPLIESPLCAVIDPVRDFRWHALRCGGPETASFLCEMNGNTRKSTQQSENLLTDLILICCMSFSVPSWALECTIHGMSNLTIQYMADNGSVELTRDCGEDEILHQICKGKQVSCGIAGFVRFFQDLCKCDLAHCDDILYFERREQQG